jgi:hypothetical protein
MSERIPLSGVLQAQQDRVVVDDVDMLGVEALERIIEIGFAVALGRTQARRKSAWVQDPSARIIERQAETECAAFPDFGDALFDFLGRYQVQAAELVVLAEFAPVRALRALCPSFGHAALLADLAS